MKKLNRKGFTLVELLAVIVILAIVVGIAIPSVTSIINSSKYSALGVAVESAIDHLQDQYNTYLVAPDAIDADMKALIESGSRTVTYEPTSAAHAYEVRVIEALGFKDNVRQVSVKITTNESSGKADICVSVISIPQNSDYFTTAHWSLSETTNAAGHTIKIATPNGSNLKAKLGNVTGACS